MENEPFGLFSPLLERSTFADWRKEFGGYRWVALSGLQAAKDHYIARLEATEDAFWEELVNCSNNTVAIPDLWKQPRLEGEDFGYGVKPRQLKRLKQGECLTYEKATITYGAICRLFRDSDLPRPVLRFVRCHYVLGDESGDQGYVLDLPVQEVLRGRATVRHSRNLQAQIDETIGTIHRQLLDALVPPLAIPGIRRQLEAAAKTCLDDISHMKGASARVCQIVADVIAPHFPASQFVVNEMKQRKQFGAISAAGGQILNEYIDQNVGDLNVRSSRA